MDENCLVLGVLGLPADELHYLDLEAQQAEEGMAERQRDEEMAEYFSQRDDFPLDL